MFYLAGGAKRPCHSQVASSPGWRDPRDTKGTRPPGHRDGDRGTADLRAGPQGADRDRRHRDMSNKGAVMSTQTNPPGGMHGESSGAADAATRAQDEAQRVAGQAQEKAQQASGQAQAKLREQLDQRSTALAEQARQQGSDLRAVSEALRDQGKDRPAQLIDRLAEYAERAGRYLHDKDADAMLGDAEDFGRQKPA